MDISIIIQTIVIPVIVIFGTQVIKKAQSIPINSGDTAKLRTVAVVMSFILTALKAYLDGNLEGFITPDMLKVGAETLITFIIAHAGYKGISKASN